MTSLTGDFSCSMLWLHHGTRGPLHYHGTVPAVLSCDLCVSRELDGDVSSLEEVQVDCRHGSLTSINSTVTTDSSSSSGGGGGGVQKVGG